MAKLHSNQVRPKYQYIFTALERANLAAGAVRVAIEAYTLWEARAALKPAYTAVFFRDRVLAQTTSSENRLFLFLALSRSNLQDKPHREEVIACSEREARILLSGRFILAFAGSLPVMEVNHV